VNRIRTAAVIALATLAILAGCSNEPYDPNNEYEMKAQCEGFAGERLKSPATADYDLEATPIPDDPQEAWEVVGTVDSENSFGAKVRSEVRCVIHFEGTTAQLDDIDINSR
jgi:hypothetical protein